jgi:hypothetical protein
MPVTMEAAPNMPATDAYSGSTVLKHIQQYLVKTGWFQLQQTCFNGLKPGAYPRLEHLKVSPLG